MLTRLHRTATGAQMGADAMPGSLIADGDDCQPVRPCRQIAFRHDDDRTGCVCGQVASNCGPQETVEPRDIICTDDQDTRILGLPGQGVQGRLVGQDALKLQG